MGRAEPLILAVIFAVFVAGYGGLSWFAGGLYLDTHEGDSYHLLDILTRMERGEVPHLDFVTPLGALSFWPIHWFIVSGQSAGAAMVLAQLSVAIVLLPIVTHAATSRLSRGLAVYFGVVTLGLALALSYGTATSGVGFSMHYNRWAWSIAFVMLLLVLVPPKGTSRTSLDGALVGLCLSALVLLKVTYFVTLAPVALIALAGLHGWRALLAALIIGLVAFLAVTGVYGIQFWLSYASDLQLVARNEIRPFVGPTFDQIVAGPKYIGATLVGIATALVVRSVRSDLVGVAALLMVPAFLYISYQNFGNDPQWLLFIPVLLLAIRPAEDRYKVLGFDTRHVSTAAAVAAFAIFLPSMFNIALSPVKHLSLGTERFLPMLPESAGHQDLFIRRDRAYTMTAQIYRDQEPGPWARYATEINRPPIPEFQGISFPHCEWMAGSRALLETLGADLQSANLPPDSTLFVADLLAAYWFFAPVSPPKGSAPWYYGELTGLQNSDYVMLPKCAFTTGVRNIVMRELQASNTRLTLVRDNALMALFQVERP